MERRHFLKTVTVGTGLSAAAPNLITPNLIAAQTSPSGTENTTGYNVAPEEAIRGDMRYRTLGRTGEKVSAIGLGGFHIGVQQDEQDSIQIIRTAIDRGITFLDNSLGLQRRRQRSPHGQGARATAIARRSS